jgi:heme exporter protein B
MVTLGEGESVNKLQGAQSLSSWGLFKSQLDRDFLLFFRQKSAWLNPLTFVFIAITLFTIGIGPDPSVLAAHAVGIVWVVTLLAVMLSLDALFRSDFDDGSLEQLMLSPQPLYLAVVAKVLAHWLVTGVPMVVAAPLLSLMLGIPSAAIPALALALLIGSGSLSFLGAIAASLTVSLRNGGLLIALLILPLYVPVIIFGSQFVEAAIHGWDVFPTVSMLLGILLAAMVLSPIAIVAGLRLSIDE